MRQDKLGGRARQRSYNRAFKTRILRECAQPGATVSGVAHAHGMNTNNIYRWRRQVVRGELKLVGAAEFVALEISPTPVLPASAPLAHCHCVLRHEPLPVGLMAGIIPDDRGQQQMRSPHAYG